MSMNYKKMWEQLKATGNQEILKQMESIEKEINKPKEIKKIDFDIYAYQSQVEIIKVLNKFSVEELRIIIKQNNYTWEYNKKDKEYIVKDFARRIYKTQTQGDSFR